MEIDGHIKQSSHPPATAWIVKAVDQVRALGSLIGHAVSTQPFPLQPSSEVLGKP